MILHTEYPKSFEMLEQASQEENESEQYNLGKENFIGDEIINNNASYNKTNSEGSENAPEDSAYISDDQDQDRIVNESSIYEDE